MRVVLLTRVRLAHQRKFNLHKKTRNKGNVCFFVSSAAAYLYECISLWCRGSRRFYTLPPLTVYHSPTELVACVCLCAPLIKVSWQPIWHTWYYETVYLFTAAPTPLSIFSLCFVWLTSLHHFSKVFVVFFDPPPAPYKLRTMMTIKPWELYYKLFGKEKNAYLALSTGPMGDDDDFVLLKCLHMKCN